MSMRYESSIARFVNYRRNKKNHKNTTKIREQSRIILKGNSINLFIPSSFFPDFLH